MRVFAGREERREKSIAGDVQKPISPFCHYKFIHTHTSLRSLPRIAEYTVYWLKKVDLEMLMKNLKARKN